MVIGPSFSNELNAAGLLGKPFSWSSDGTLSFDPSMTQTDRDAVRAVLAAHDPTVKLPDIAGFSSWMLGYLSFARQKVLRLAEPNFWDYIQAANFDGMRWCITDGYSAGSGSLTAQEYADFQAAWVTYHFPGAKP